MKRVNRKNLKKKKIFLFTSLIIICSIMIVGYSIFNTNLSINTKGNIKEFVKNFDYTGSEQTFTVPYDGIYQLEVWGSGTDELYNGFGGYSAGNIRLSKNSILYLNIGGKPVNNRDGGYNGGGSCESDGSPGGGATDISLNNGLLSSLENKNNLILIVAGGAGGSDGDDIKYYSKPIPGSGGGFNGTRGYVIRLSDSSYKYFGNSGSQIQGGIISETDLKLNGTFGKGGNCYCVKDETNYYDCGGAGGGGFYGGSSSGARGGPGAGGSGYIGNSQLTNKHMACYNCEESDEESTKTISITCASVTPTKDCAKIGNGYARITYLGK